MRITGLYVALGVLLVLMLAVRVSLRRRTARIGIGDGDDAELRKRIRAHGNAIEYLPIGRYTVSVQASGFFAMIVSANGRSPVRASA